MAAVGQATGLQAQPNFSDHLFCIWGAHWTADKMFCDLGNLLETNCVVQVQRSWTAGCPAKWENQIQHRLEEWSENSYLGAEHAEYFAHTESWDIDKSMFACWWFAGILQAQAVRIVTRPWAFFMHFVLVRVSTREHVNGPVWEDNLLLQT